MIQLFDIKGLEDHYLVKFGTKEDGAVIEFPNDTYNYTSIYYRVNAFSLDTGKMVWSEYRRVIHKDNVELLKEALKYYRSSTESRFIILNDKGDFKVTNTADPKFPHVAYFKHFKKVGLKSELKKAGMTDFTIKGFKEYFGDELISIDEEPIPYKPHTAIAAQACASESEGSLRDKVASLLVSNDVDIVKPYYIDKKFKLSKKPTEYLYAVFLVNNAKKLMSILDIKMSDKGIITKKEVDIIFKFVPHAISKPKPLAKVILTVGEANPLLGSYVEEGEESQDL